MQNIRSEEKTILPRAGKGPRFGSFFSHDHPHDSQGKVCYTKVGPGRKGLSESGLRIASYLGLYLSFQIRLRKGYMSARAQHLKDLLV